MEAELRERIESYNSETEDLRNDIESFCADMSVDLDIRWNLFVESKLGSINPYILDFGQLGFEVEDVIYEPRKFQHIDLIDMVSTIEKWVHDYGKMTEDELPEGQKDKFGKFSNDVVIKFKEFLLDNFTKECVMDW